jgi:tetraacyldisaccharide 4'-kinase
LSWGYGAAVALRNLAFDAGVFKSRAVEVPVIAVGNLTAGGTGKTPVVELLLRSLISRKLLPGMISRGYGRSSRGVVIVAGRTGVRVDARAGGDEPLQIAKKFPGVPVVVAERRYDAARTIVKHCGAEVIVSDDGFQHRWLHRDCDIVVVDGSRDLSKEPLLPAGLRREQLRGLNRAHLIAVTGTSGAGELELRTRGLRRWFDGPVVAIERSFGWLEDLQSGERFPADRLSGKACYAFSAIGNPAGFTGDLERAGARVVRERRFRDHHYFTAKEAAEIAQEARDAGATALVTTEKDLVRLQSEHRLVQSLLQSMPVWIPVLAVRMVPSEPLEDMITKLTGRS